MTEPEPRSLFAERREAAPEELARLRESFGVEPPPDGLFDAEAIFLRGGGDARDQDAFQWALGRAADSTFEPELLVEPFGDGRWLIDAVHRAAALYAKRREAGDEVLRLPVFVLPSRLRG